MLIPAYVYLRCEKCGADHGRLRISIPGEGGFYERMYEPGAYRIWPSDRVPFICLACGESTVRTFFETNEFRGE